MATNKIFLLTLGISSRRQLEEYDLDYWHKNRYLELQESTLSKKEINEKLIELNNAKEYLDQFTIDDLIRSFTEKKSTTVNVDINENKKSYIDNNHFFQKEIKREVTLTNKNKDYFLNRGLKKYELEDYKSAIEDFSNVLKLNPKNEDAYFYRGHAKYELEDNIGALNDLKKVLKLNPRDEDAFHTCGHIYCRLEKFLDAKNAFTKVIELNPNHDEAYTHRGYAKSKLKDFHGEFEDYTKAIEINPQNDFALYNRGLLKRNHFNDWEGAMEDFQKSKLDSSGGLNFIYKYPYQSLIFFAILFTTAFIIILLGDK